MVLHISQLKERTKRAFCVEKNYKRNNQHNYSYKHNIKGFLHPIEINSKLNIFNVEISNKSKHIPSFQLKNTVLIEITNKEIIQKILPKIEKRSNPKTSLIINLRYY